MSEPAVAAAETAASGRHPVARLHAAVWSRVAVGVAVAVLGTLLLVKVVGSSAGPRTHTALAPTPPTVLAEVSGIPAAVYDRVGVESPTVPIAPPAAVAAADVLRARDGGATVPVVLFVGAEYCSFCAAERWPLVAALARFGTFTRLYDVQSSSIDFAPNTPTFSFVGVRYHSPYLVFRAYETASDVLGPHGYAPLMRLPARVAAAARAIDPRGVLPVVDVAGTFDAPQAAVSPITFAGTTREQIAGGLTDPTSPVTQSIVASANYLTAAICEADGQRPGAVCRSRGVLAADAALGPARTVRAR